MKPFLMFLACLFFINCGPKKIITLPDGATPYLVVFDEQDQKLKCFAEQDDGKLKEIEPKHCRDRMAFSKGQVFRIFERLKACPEVQEFVSETMRLNLKKSKKLAAN
jgi:hypothetical protein